METILIVSSNEKGNSLIVELLKSQYSSKINTVKSGSEARRILIDNIFDIVIINSPLIDEFGTELALNIINSTLSSVILIAKSEMADEIKVENYGVFVVPKPINKQFLFQCLKFIATSRKRILGLKNENIKLQQKIEEIRLIDRAKCILIQYLNFTEVQAHRYIEKQAMDMRITKREVAEGILKTYES